MFLIVLILLRVRVNALQFTAISIIHCKVSPLYDTTISLSWTAYFLSLFWYFTRYSFMFSIPTNPSSNQSSSELVDLRNPCWPTAPMIFELLLRAMFFSHKTIVRKLFIMWLLQNTSREYFVHTIKIFNKVYL